MAIGDGARFGYGLIVGVSEEATFGTKVDSFKFLEVNSEGFKRNLEEKKLETLNGTRDYIKRMLGNESVEGALEFPLDLTNDGIVYIIKQAMGGTISSATIVAAGGYIHTVNAGDMDYNKSTSGAADVKSLSFQIRKGASPQTTGTLTGTVFDFLGCRVNSLSFKAEIGEPVVVSAEIIGKTATITSSTPTATFTAFLPADFTGVTIQTGGTTTALSTETFIGFELTINNNLVSDNNARALGSRTVTMLPPTRREISLKLIQRFDTYTAYSAAIANTATAIQIKIDSGYTIATAASTYSMLINLPGCYYNTPAIPDVGDAGLLTVTHELSCIRKDTTSNYAIQMQINNNTASY